MTVVGRAPEVTEVPLTKELVLTVLEVVLVDVVGLLFGGSSFLVYLHK